MTLCRTALLPAVAPVTLFVALTAAVAGGQASQAQEPPDPRALGSLLDDAGLVVSAEGIDHLLVALPRAGWSPGVARFRGGADLYAKVAPAVVVVRTSEGHGTGFLISPDGWILTNHHVVLYGLTHDPGRQASYATVHLGWLGPDGAMSLSPAPSRAYVHKLDRARDLALLKLDPVPSGLPALTLSLTSPRPGMNASMIGHPSSGLLWTYRTGQISAVGRAPADMVDLVMTRLAATGGQREQVAAAIRQLPTRRIVLSSCEANPGDSGGPLVDDSGQVVAVTFAIPLDPTEAKFTYHVHLEEVKAFVEARPARPVLAVPDPWNAGPRASFKDLDGDTRKDTLTLGDDEPEMMLFDLSGRTSFAGLASDDAARKKLVAEKGWRFDVALQMAGSEWVVHYDTDGDGELDLILVGPAANKATVRMTRTAGSAWSVAPASGPVLSTTYLADTPRRKRLAAILQKIKESEGARDQRRR